MKSSTEICNASQNTYGHVKEVEASLLEHDSNPVSSSSSTSSPPAATTSTTTYDTASPSYDDEADTLHSRPPMILTSELNEKEDECSQPEKEHTPTRTKGIFFLGY